jgi:hypothetical protein
LLTSAIASMPTAFAATVTPGSTAPPSPEHRVLQELAPLASRDGKTLSLTLLTTAQVKLQSADSCAAPGNCRIYRLQGLSPDRQFFDVALQRYEAATRFWIARASGKQYDVHAEPHVSPDQTRIVTANAADFGSLNGVFLWEIRGGELIEQFRLEPTEYALYRFVRWSSPHAVELSKLSQADKAICPSSQMMSAPARLTRQDGKWTLDERIAPAMATCQ